MAELKPMFARLRSIATDDGEIDLSCIITQRDARPPRVILLGTEKIGKSTFAAGADAPLFLPIAGEEGIDGIEVPAFPTIGSFEELVAALAGLTRQKHGYRTLVIDSASALEPLIHDYVCRREGSPSIEKVGGGFGKGYNHALDCWRDVMALLDVLREQGMASILVGHVIRSVVADPMAEPYDAYAWDLNKKAAAALYRWADSILFAAWKAPSIDKQDMGFQKKSKRAVGPSVRVLYTQARPAHPGGGRNVYGRLPYELDLSWGAFIDAVGTASAANGASNGKEEVEEQPETKKRKK